ncbi:MAG: hypothetical protein MUF38_04095 [Anaerolineae bacterium]|nr:hypothetical protein [Anaerolineae bacterium]
MTHSPIYAAERRHQRFVLQSNRSATLWIWVAILMLVPALLTAVVATVVALFNVPILEQFLVNQESFGSWLNNIISTGLVLMLAMNIAHTLVLALVSAGLAAESIQREHRRKTWDLLLLTGQSARSIARGKITAAFWTLRRDLLMVVILRLGLISVAYVVSRQGPLMFGSPVPQQNHLVVLLVITALWTIIDSFTAVALAIAAAALPARARLMGGLVGLLVRVALMASGVLWLMMVFGAMNGSPDRPTYAVLGVIGLLVYTIFAYCSVWLAEFALRFAGASPHPSPFAAKPPAPPAPFTFTDPKPTPAP